MKIGIFGGCFNPPHSMHKQIALDLIKKKYVDKVIYVPTGNNYQKKDLIAANHRYEMIKKMIDNNKKLYVSDYELKNKLKYTYQTLDHFKKEFSEDEIYFICGSDNLNEITTWKNYQHILKDYKLLVIQRNEDNINTKIKNIVKAKINTSFLSSTMIRKNIKDKNIRKYLDKKVLKYIDINHLYEE